MEILSEIGVDTLLGRIPRFCVFPVLCNRATWTCKLLAKQKSSFRISVYSNVLMMIKLRNNRGQPPTASLQLPGSCPSPFCPSINCIVTALLQTKAC